MLEQRLQQRPRLLLIPPAILVLVVALGAVIFARSPGAQPREAIFDLFARTAPRVAVAEPSVVVIDIDEESLAARGPWPWPRSAIAQLVEAAADAGARGIVVTVPLEGIDPLSPETISRFFARDPRSDPAVSALAQLPTTNAALSDAATLAPTALGVGASPAPQTQWDRADMSTVEWLTAGPNRTTDYIALPAAPVFAHVDPGFSETASVVVSALPTDPDGMFRRTPLLWSIDQRPAPSAAFASFAFGTEPLNVAIAGRQLRAGGPPPAGIEFADGDELRLDARGGVQLWLPRELDLPQIPAWRVLEGDGTWTGPVAGRIVFIGESISPRALLDTPRGEMSVAAIHAHLAEQIALGVAPVRPGWGGLFEAFLALLAGAAGIAAAMYLRPSVVAAVSLTLSLATAIGFFAIFGRTGILLDPLPVALAAIGAPIAIFGVVVSNILMRDDALRGAFHGSLPTHTMQKLQTSGGARLLNGVRREVTVLSSRLRIPEDTIDKFRERPDDFIRFTAAANDALRRTILAHDGTVDYGEDGRLLAYWNVPEPTEHAAEKACACSLKMIDAINALTEQVETAAMSSGRRRGLDIGFADTSIEIGLARSMCFAGPVGRSSRNRYSVIGEAVGYASALRRRSTRYGPTIITDDVVFDALRHHYAFLDLDVLRFGKDGAPRTVYGLVGNPFLKASKAFRQLSDVQRELVLNWRTGDLAKATVQLQRLRGLPGATDTYVDLFEKRLAEARAAGDVGPDELIEVLRG